MTVLGARFLSYVKRADASSLVGRMSAGPRMLLVGTICPLACTAGSQPACHTTECPPVTEQTATSLEAPSADQICDGSNDIRLQYAAYDGERPFTWAPVMAREGRRYLWVNGMCQFVAFDGDGRELGHWAPVFHGVLSLSEMSDLLEDLDVVAWMGGENGKFEATPKTGHVHAGRMILKIGDVDASCEACNASAEKLSGRIEEVVASLIDSGTPVVTEIAEVLVFDRLHTNQKKRWTVHWKATDPLDDFLGQRGQDGESLGRVVAGDDVAWFATIQEQFQDAAASGFPDVRRQHGIYVGDPPEYELFIRTVVDVEDFP